MDVSGERAKPHRQLRVGDGVAVTRESGQRRQLVVRGLASHSVPRREARALYEDVTPATPPERLEVRRLDRMLARQDRGARPSSRERRERRRRKGWSDDPGR